jgi:hypothetical protein
MSEEYNTLDFLIEKVDVMLVEMDVDPERLPKYDPGLLHSSKEEALIEARIWLYRAKGRQPEPPESPTRRTASRPKKKQKKKRTRKKKLRDSAGLLINVLKD